MPKHNCLPPLRTGREDFPHPALTQTLAAQQYAGRNRLSSAAQPRSKMRTVPQPRGWFSVGGLSSKRNSHPLIQHVGVPAPSLHGRYPLPRYYEPVRLPTEPPQSYAFPSGVGLLAPTTPPGLPGSSTDLSPRAVPNHPGEPGDCSCPIASPPVSGFVTYGSLAALSLHNEAESGSLALRLMGSPRPASCHGLLRPTRAPLPVEWAITG